MRIAAWAFVVCTLASVIGVFLPSVELEVGGVSLGRRGSLSLYQANTNRDFVRKVVRGYHKSAGKRIGAALVPLMLPRIGGKAHGYVDDAKDAMDTLDDVSEADAKTLGTVLAVTIWAFLFLHLVMGGLVFVEAMRDRFRRGRVIAALAVSVIVTTIAIAIHLVIEEAVWEANDEVGKTVVGAGVGAYLIPLASIAGAIAAIALVVLVQRSRARAPRPA